jgi:LPPG:FO 2-phospho-L-lactate transferase
MICVLTGGTGGAKLVDGLRHVVPAEDLTIVVNTGDDSEWWGLNISPDIDSIIYMLAGTISTERGWGVRGDTFHCLQTMKSLGEPAWFSIGDRDLAMHLLRMRLLSSGNTLSEATQEIANRLGVRSCVLPMSNERVRTIIETPAGELSFEEYFVKRRYQDQVLSVRFEGASEAKPAPGLLDAIASAEAVLIAPSNPVTSIGPLLAIPGTREALTCTSATVVAVSPIIGGAAVSGPAGNLMSAQGLKVSIQGIAAAYEDFLDVLIAHTTDAETARALTTDRLQVYCTNILMNTIEDRTQLARTALSVSCREASTVGAAEAR